jgi:hypothetical protein
MTSEKNIHNVIYSIRKYKVYKFSEIREMDKYAESNMEKAKWQIAIYYGR